MRRAYSYIRMSTKEQQTGDSERRQLVRARRWAEEHGYELDESLKDIGLSGYTGSHRAKGALGEFLRRARDGEINRGSVLIAEKMDRLSREVVLTAFDGFRELIGLGIRVALLDLKKLVDEDAINDDPHLLGNLMSLMQLAHQESKNKSDRLLEAADEKRFEAVKGVIYTRHVPAWLSVDKETREWVRHPDREAIVVEILELARQGWGAPKIAQHLNAKGTPTFGRSKAWGLGYVGKIMRNEAVIGTWQPRREDWKSGKTIKVGDPITSYFPQIVDKAVWLEVQRQIRPRIAKGPKGKGFANLFGGIAFCAKCGGAMHAHPVQKPNRPKYTYMVCSTKRAGTKPVCTAERNFRLDLIEDDVLRSIGVDLGRVVRDEKVSAEIKAVTSRLADAEVRLDHARQGFDNLQGLAERASPAVAERMLPRIEAKAAEMTCIESEVSTIKAELEVAKKSLHDRAKVLGTLKEKLTQADPEELFVMRQRMSLLIKDFVQRLDFDPAANEVRVRSGPNLYAFSGTGGLSYVLIPRLPGAMPDLTEWSECTKERVIEEGDRLRFRTVEAAVMFKMGFAEAV